MPPANAARRHTVAARCASTGFAPASRLTGNAVEHVGIAALRGAERRQRLRRRRRVRLALVAAGGVGPPHLHHPLQVCRRVRAGGGKGAGMMHVLSPLQPAANQMPVPQCKACLHRAGRAAGPFRCGAGLSPWVPHSTPSPSPSPLCWRAPPCQPTGASLASRRPPSSSKKDSVVWQLAGISSTIQRTRASMQASVSCARGGMGRRAAG